MQYLDLILMLTQYYIVTLQKVVQEVYILKNSDVPGLDFSGFGQARALMYRASGGPGFSVSGFEPFSGFSKV